MAKYCRISGLYVTYLDCMECEEKGCQDKGRNCNVKILHPGDVFRINEGKYYSSQITYLGKTKHGKPILHLVKDRESGNKTCFIVCERKLSPDDLVYIAKNRWWEKLRKRFDSIDNSKGVEVWK